jgi:N-[(2S)-2-amino-2-carboxyethyl]-L-glutamate dehydrogenase
VRDEDLLVLNGSAVIETLAGQELAVLDAVRKAYHLHGKYQTSLPHSIFLNFPDHPANRIIALPAYLGGEVNAAGIKWIASFPANVQDGLDRASAVMILNSAENGRPKAILEGSIISARRTAASAAIAAQLLICKKTAVAGLIGCGLINFEIVRFLLKTCPTIEKLIVFDLNPESALFFKNRCAETFADLEVVVAGDGAAVFENSLLVSFATTAGKPHVRNLEMCAPGTVVLHVSLRDLTPDVILASDNVVDDIDHVCRAQTSIHLTEEQEGNRRFIRCTLADILNGVAAPRMDEDGTVVFSPFGLGILDLAVAEVVVERARERGCGSVIPSFLPLPWRQAYYATVA